MPGESFAAPIEVFGPGRPARIPALDEAHARDIDARVGTREMTSTTQIVDAVVDEKARHVEFHAG